MNSKYPKNTESSQGCIYKIIEYYSFIKYGEQSIFFHGSQETNFRELNKGTEVQFIISYYNGKKVASNVRPYSKLRPSLLKHTRNIDSRINIYQDNETKKTKSKDTKDKESVEDVLKYLSVSFPKPKPKPKNTHEPNPSRKRKTPVGGIKPPTKRVTPINNQMDLKVISKVDMNSIVIKAISYGMISYKNGHIVYPERHHYNYIFLIIENGVCKITYYNRGSYTNYITKEYVNIAQFILYQFVKNFGSPSKLSNSTKEHSFVSTSLVKTIEYWTADKRKPIINATPGSNIANITVDIDDIMKIKGENK